MSKREFTRVKRRSAVGPPHRSSQAIAFKRCVYVCIHEVDVLKISLVRSGFVMNRVGHSNGCGSNVARAGSGREQGRWGPRGPVYAPAQRRRE